MTLCSPRIIHHLHTSSNATSQTSANKNLNYQITHISPQMLKTCFLTYYYFKAIKSLMQQYQTNCVLGCSKSRNQIFICQNHIIRSAQIIQRKIDQRQMTANSVNAKCCGYKHKQSGESILIQVITRVGMWQSYYVITIF
ncbi:unnamed protein product [Paramecium octaurelia]|uniref:Uncharacterized protein n=1 Tax=Paramecium octaurelia TaxID=43137 RepID=A0A8S1XCI2_PAROT|nr:unnamed protein product [Paramecium octaurelia]